MSDLSRRAFGAILGSGAFVWFDKNYQGNGGTGGGNVTNPEAADIQLDDAVLDVTSDTVTVDVDAANFGGETGDATVLFRDQVEELASQNVTLEAGAVEALQFTNDYTNITADDVTLDVVNDQYPLAVDLTVPRPNIQFTGGRIEDTNGNEITEITEGQTFYVVGTAENVGDRDGEKTYVLYGNDTEIDSQLVTLTTGGSTTLEFSHSYDNLDLGPDETAKQVDLSVNEQGVGEISIFPPAIPDSGVTRLEFEDDSETITAVDSWGDNNASISGATYTPTAQVGSFALDFDPSNSAYLDLGENTLATTAPFSVSVWVYPRDWTSARFDYIASWESGTSPYLGWALRDDNNDSNPFGISIKDGSGSNYSAQTSRPTTNAWTLITATYGSDGTLTLYLDDVQSAQNTGADGSLSQVTADVQHGANTANRGRYFDGIQDDPRYYNKELSATEVSNLFDTGSING